MRLTPCGCVWLRAYVPKNVPTLRRTAVALAAPCTPLHNHVLDGGRCWPRRRTDARPAKQAIAKKEIKMASGKSSLKKSCSLLSLWLMAVLSVGLIGCQDTPTDVTDAPVQLAVGGASVAAGFDSSSLTPCTDRTTTEPDTIGIGRCHRIRPCGRISSES